MVSDQTDERLWYAMRATYRRELIAQRALEACGIESFVPMRYELKMQGGRRRRLLVPAIHNLIFVHAHPEELQKAKERMPYLQYMMRKGLRDEQGRGEKMIIPAEQMIPFMAVAGMLDEHLTYYSPEQVNLTLGQRVKIHGGKCDGYEGRLVKVPGFRNRKVVVAIEGVMAVALANVLPEQLEVL
ncbi:MAG: UpxY family transcription antiterminator [Alistipes sp.]|nr:UpxY family transcription antiterminator [Alistipes sp.]MBQ2393017.1 UpxY family transcription antiterminator [Alistipes sp.]MBQ5395172.1 UpxY family transcription antiterminator [Alistipes sp.]MBR0330737.1 UpxY family transcription antiterminator [Alistipes sp.]